MPDDAYIFFYNNNSLLEVVSKTPNERLIWNTVFPVGYREAVMTRREELQNDQ